MRLDGKIALITGAGRGIGRTMALTLANAGADLCINDVNLDAAEETAEEVRALGRKAIAVKADVGDPGEVDAMVTRTIEQLGGIHILVNNAGIIDQGVPTTESAIEKWDEVFRVIVRGTYLCCRRAGQWMVEHRTGKIVNISSVAAFTGLAPRPAYVPAKGAVVDLTHTLAVEWAPYGINVNCIAPGFCLTPMSIEAFKRAGADLDKVGKNVPMGRLAVPQDLADATLFLVSDLSDYITGVTLPVDGGWLVYRTLPRG
ncbi:MAG: SDR family oxidoreductase [Dehalococcoidia bacterium]|nr:SDR family oxidoreductase [Dehalococcoidia bacterium]